MNWMKLAAGGAVTLAIGAVAYWYGPDSAAKSDGLTVARAWAEPSHGQRLATTTIWGQKQTPAGRLLPPPAEAQRQNAPQQNTPQRFETTIYKSWRVTCQQRTVSGAKKKVCAARMRVLDQKKRTVLLIWQIGRNAQGKLELLIDTPSGVQITRGVEVKLGKGAVHRLTFIACMPQRCEASGPMDGAMVKEAMAAADASVTIYGVDGRTIKFDMPVTGLDKALADIG